MRPLTRPPAIAVPLIVLFVALVAPAAAAPEGTMTWGVHVPVYELAFPWGIEPRVEEAGVDHIKGLSREDRSHA